MPNQSTDFIPYLFLAAVILVGGLVAFVADGMGRKIGKKRLSFFGLRPRHTATIITVGAGILIPILTIGAIYALSSDVREWIKEGRGAIRRAQDAQTREQEANKRVDDAKETEKKLSDKNAKQTTKITKQEQEIKNFESQIKQADTKLKTSEAKANSALKKKVQLEGNLVVTNRNIQSLTAEKAAKQADINLLKRESNSLKQSYKAASEQLKENKTRADELDREVARQEGELKKLDKSLADQLALKTEYEGLIKSYKESIEGYQETIGQYTKSITELQNQKSQLSGQLTSNVILSRTKPLIFDASEELARIQLPPSLSPVAARSAYFDLVQRAKNVAQARGAGNAGLIPLNLENPFRVVSVAEQEEAVIRGLVAQRDDLVFIARSPFNAFEGEPMIQLELVAFRNRLVYKEGQVITEARIDGRRQDIEIYNSIQKFVSENVRAKALKDGMIPPSGRNASLGSVENDDLLALIKNIKAENLVIRLQAIAKQDTMSGDQLELIFRIRY